METKVLSREYRFPDCQVSDFCPDLLCESPSGETESFVDDGTFQW